MLEALIPYNGIRTVVSAKVLGYDGRILRYEKDGAVHELVCDSVILSVGYREENALYDKLKGSLAESYVIGDARKVANIMYAVWDAFEVANSI